MERSGLTYRSLMVKQTPSPFARSRPAFKVPAVCAAIFLLALAANAQNSATPLTPSEIRELIARAIVAQHKDDAALDEYERTERVVTRERDGAMHETTSRVVPHGSTGTFRVQLEHDGMATDPRTLATQWLNVQKTMAIYADTNNPAVKSDLEKAARETREIDRLKDAIAKAFVFHWVARTTRAGRTMVEVSFEPDPEYKPNFRYANLLQHIRGVAWVDESTGHVARVEANLFDDVSFGGGVIAKLYRGAHMTYDQAEMAPGIWLPTGYDVDIDGRKFVFPLNLHQRDEITAYRRVGQPQEAVALLEHDLPVVPAADPPAR